MADPPLEDRTDAEFVTLNVGGRKFLTMLGTLRAVPDSMLARMFMGAVPVARASTFG